MSDVVPRRRRFSEVVESGVEGLYDFLFRLLATLWLVSVRRQPIRILAADRHRDRVSMVFPFTYAAIGIFLVSLVAAVAGSNILDWLWFSDEISENVVKNIASGVSFTAIAIGSVPAFLFTLLVAGVFRLLMGRRMAGSGRALYVTCYAIGSQSIYLFFAVSFLSFAQVLPGGVGSNKIDGLIAEILNYFVLALILTALIGVIIVPIIFYYRSFINRQKIGIKSALQFIAIVVLSVICAAVLPAMAGIPTQLSAAVKPDTKPDLTIDEFTTLKPGVDGLLAVDIVLHNKSDTLLALSSRTASVLLLVGKSPADEDPNVDRVGMDIVRVEDENGNAVSFTVVPPKSTVWRRLVVAAPESLLTRLSAGNWCVGAEIGQGSESVKRPCVYASLD